MTPVHARWATAAETTDWDTLVAQSPAGGDFLLTTTFADTKRSVGWHPRFAVFTGADNAPRAVALILERRIPFLGAYWYVTRGPAVTTAADFTAHADALARLARADRRRVFGITIEPPVERTQEGADPEPDIAAWLAQNPNVAARPAIQGNAETVVVDIDRDDDALIGSFDKKCRNMVRRAERDGAVVREYPADETTFAHMHRLMRLVGGGKSGLALRDNSYTEQLWRGYAAAGQGRFFGIDVDGTPALLSFVIRVGRNATYKDGGSERDRTSPGMSNYLQWEAMRRMRDEGATSYDLFGIAPEWAQSVDDHPAFLLGRFKLSFGPRRSHIGAFDVVLRPTQWKLWTKFGERVVSALHRRKYNDLSLF